jgi:hypothetical protein
VRRAILKPRGAALDIGPIAIRARARERISAFGLDCVDQDVATSVREATDSVASWRLVLRFDAHGDVSTLRRLQAAT